MLEGVEGDEVRIEADLGEMGRQVVGLPIKLVGEARLVLTDDLIREALRRAKKAGKEAAKETSKDAGEADQGADEDEAAAGARD